MMENIDKKYRLEVEINDYRFPKIKLLKFLKYKKTIIGVFGQAKAFEVYEYIKNSKDPLRILDWYENRLYKNTNATKKDMPFLMKKLDQIILFLRETYFDGCFAKGDGKPKDREPFDSGIVRLCDNNPKTYYWMIQNLSIPQIHRFLECKVWNLQEQSKEGQSKNRMKASEMRQKEMTPEEQAKFKQFLDLIPD